MISIIQKRMASRPPSCTQVRAYYPIPHPPVLVRCVAGGWWSGQHVLTSAAGKIVNHAPLRPFNLGSAVKGRRERGWGSLSDPARLSRGGGSRGTAAETGRPEWPGIERAQWELKM